jgi:hypothetical protein
VEPLFATGRISILDHPEQARELKQLERRARSGGRTIVDHPPRGHDDFANVLCLAAVAQIAASEAAARILSHLGIPTGCPQPLPARSPPGPEKVREFFDFQDH